MTSEASIRAAVEGTGRLVVQSLTPTGILSRKTLNAAEGKATWEESLKVRRTAVLVCHQSSR